MILPENPVPRFERRIEDAFASHSARVEENNIESILPVSWADSELKEEVRRHFLCQPANEVIVGLTRRALQHEFAVFHGYALAAFKPPLLQHRGTIKCGLIRGMLPVHIRRNKPLAHARMK